MSVWSFPPCYLLSASSCPPFMVSRGCPTVQEQLLLKMIGQSLLWGWGRTLCTYARRGGFQKAPSHCCQYIKKLKHGYDLRSWGLEEGVPFPWPTIQLYLHIHTRLYVTKEAGEVGKPAPGYTTSDSETEWLLRALSSVQQQRWTSTNPPQE